MSRINFTTFMASHLCPSNIKHQISPEMRGFSEVSLTQSNVRLLCFTFSHFPGVVKVCNEQENKKKSSFNLQNSSPLWPHATACWWPPREPVIGPPAPLVADRGTRDQYSAAIDAFQPDSHVTSVLCSDWWRAEAVPVWGGMD